MTQKRVQHTGLMDLKVDFAFKRLFGQPQNADIMIAFLNALLKRTEANNIVSITFPNTVLTAETFGDKESRLDIVVLTDTGERINVEIQLSNEYDMPQRSLFYWTNLFRTQAYTGMQYTELNRTIAINIVNYICFPSTPNHQTTYHVSEDISRMLLTDLLEIHFIELPKLRKAYAGNLEDFSQDVLGRWLLLLDAANNDLIRNALEVQAMNEPLIQKAFEVWEQMSQDPETQFAYLSRQKAMMDKMDREAALAEARDKAIKLGKEQGWAEGKQQGLEQGMEKGLKQGMEQGLEQGLEQGRREEALAIARRLLQKGLDIPSVAEFTGMSPKEVEKLISSADTQD